MESLKTRNVCFIFCCKTAIDLLYKTGYEERDSLFHRTSGRPISQIHFGITSSIW